MHTLRPNPIVGGWWLLAVFLGCSETPSLGGSDLSQVAIDASQKEADGASMAEDLTQSQVDLAADLASVDAALPPLSKESRFGREVVRYTTVHKVGHDRLTFVEEAAVATIPAAGPLPDGLSIYLLVGGTVFVRQKRGAIWFSTSGSAAGAAPTPTSQMGGCDGCHNAAAGESTYTLPSLLRLVRTHLPSEVNCPMANNTPCAAAVYAN